MTPPTNIFIVPYRDRESFKNVYINQMKWILEDEAESYEIFFSHQNDIRPFNRGAMKNLGFWYARQKYPDHYKKMNFIFQDVDTIPGKKGLFTYETTVGVVKHYYGFNFALGGIFSIKGSDFELLNGFPNFWGWGFEDNIINNRCKENNITIDRTNWFKYGDYNILQFTSGPYRMVDNSAVKKQAKIHRQNGLSKITNVTFDITSMSDDNSIQMVNFSAWSIPESHENVQFRATKSLRTLRDNNSKRSSIMNSLIHHKK